MKTKRFAIGLCAWLLLVAPLLAADIRWIGAANDIAQVDEAESTGTFAADDTVYCEINNKRVTVTLGTDIAVADTVAELSAAINAAAITGGEVGTTLDETRNAGGQSIGEFRDVIASYDATKIYLTSKVPGTPFTASFGDTAGSGALASGTTTTAATGRNHWSNVNNWSTGALPVGDDTAVFDNGGISCIYNTNNATEEINLKRYNGYFGNIGLPDINTTHPGKHYFEYRGKYLTLPNLAATGDQTVVVGDSGSAVRSQGTTRLDLGTNAGNSLTVTINDSPAFDATLGAAVRIIGGNSSQLVATGGSVQVGGSVSDTATVSSVTKISGNAYVHITDQCQTIALIPARPMYGGTLIDEGTGTVGGITLYGGQVFSRRTAGTPGTVTLHGGSYVAGETFTTLVVHSGAAFSVKDGSSITVTNATVYQGFSLSDPNNQVTWTNGIDFVGCQPSSGRFNVAESQTWTPSAL